jgi:hypothetical protein
MLPASTSFSSLASVTFGAVTAPTQAAVAESSGSELLPCSILIEVDCCFLAEENGNCLHLTGVEGPLGVRINGHRPAHDPFAHLVNY